MICVPSAFPLLRTAFYWDAGSAATSEAAVPEGRIASVVIECCNHDFVLLDVVDDAVRIPIQYVLAGRSPGRLSSERVLAQQGNATTNLCIQALPRLSAEP